MGSVFSHNGFVSAAAKSLVLLIMPALIISVIAAACSRKTAQENTMTDEVVAEVGDSALMLTEVQRRIPYGVSSADSLALFNSIVDSWIERLLLESFGNENIDDMENIERMVEEYRKKLIVASFRRSLRASHRWHVSEDSVRKYYMLHSDEFVLGRPVIKGLYLKIPSDNSRLPDIRRWMMTATPDAVDNLERYGLSDAIEYSFFTDKWTDFNIFTRKIPYRFEDQDKFVEQNRNFETSYRGMTYLLHISSFLPSGEKMPYDVASPQIAEVLEGDSGEKYERQLIASLYARARKEGKLRDYRGNLGGNNKEKTESRSNR